MNSMYLLYYSIQFSLESLEYPAKTRERLIDLGNCKNSSPKTLPESILLFITILIHHLKRFPVLHTGADVRFGLRDSLQPDVDVEQVCARVTQDCGDYHTPAIQPDL